MRGITAFVLAASTMILTSALPACGQCSLSVLSGPINDPSNRGLRRDILSYGIGKFCTEMVKHNAPLALQTGTPSIGRFFPRECVQQTLANGDLYVQFKGVGYAWTNVSHRIGFTMEGTVVYDPDFLMDGCTAYAYFRTRQVQASNFNISMIEQPVANIINQLTPLGAQFGQQLVNAQLQQGFTVLRDGNGSSDFGIGMIEKGKQPTHPFDLHGSNHLLYENNRTEIHYNQRDFIGPIVIEDSGRALYMQAQVDGVPAVDLIVLERTDALPWLDNYYANQMAAPLAPVARPLAGDVLQQGMPYRRALPVPPGVYWVVLDNTPGAGQAMPSPQLLGDTAAAVSYAIEIGDAP